MRSFNKNLDIGIIIVYKYNQREVKDGQSK